MTNRVYTPEEIELHLVHAREYVDAAIAGDVDFWSLVHHYEQSAEIIKQLRLENKWFFDEAMAHMARCEDIAICVDDASLPDFPDRKGCEYHIRAATQEKMKKEIL